MTNLECYLCLLMEEVPHPNESFTFVKGTLVCAEHVSWIANEDLLAEPEDEDD